MDYQPYPKWVRCLDGAKRVAQNAQEHSVLTGVKHNLDGTPAAIESVAVEPRTSVEVASSATFDVDPLGEPSIAPEKPRRRGKAVA